MSSKPKSKIAKRLTIYVILFSSLITLVSTAYTLYRDYINDINQIDKRFDQVKRVHLKALAHAMWALDKKDMDIQVKGMLTMPDIKYIAVYDSVRLFAKHGDMPKTRLKGRTFNLHYRYRQQDLIIGKVTVVASLEGVYQRLYNRFWVILIVNGIKTFLVAGFILWLFGFLVTRHLTRISSFVSSVSVENLEEDFKFSGKRIVEGKIDELDQLAESLNQMRGELKQSIGRIQENERELDRHREGLENLVHERTRELEATNQELEAFSYTVSHDLRAPLRAIEGFSRILREESQGKLDSGEVVWLNRIRDSASHMSRLIEDLLKLSSVMKGALQPRLIDVSAVCRNICKQHKDIVARCSSSLRKVDIKIDPGLFATADRALMEVVLTNLIENAYKYTSKQDNPVVKIGSSYQRGHTYFYVRDNGVGLNMKYADRLFSAFQRLHTDEDFPGSGIGLATVKRVLNRHGGDVFVESMVGEGACFYFRVPKMTVAEAAASHSVV